MGFEAIFFETHDDAYYREPQEGATARLVSPQDPAERKVFIPFRKCRYPVQLLFGTFLLLVGFLAFNPASTFATTLGRLVSWLHEIFLFLRADLIVAHSSATTLLAAAGGGVGGQTFKT